MQSRYHQFYKLHSKYAYGTSGGIHAIVYLLIYYATAAVNYSTQELIGQINGTYFILMRRLPYEMYEA